jgi:inorganic triphosphatase YgiF
MHEIELKFRVSAARRAAVARAVAGPRPGAPLRLQAAYFDTSDRALARAGLALRLRREGSQWVQTLKGTGNDGMTRLEHNAPRAGPGAALPALDLELHAGTGVGDRLTRVLRDATEPTLQCLFRTDIRRLRRAVRTARGTVELAFDTGHILAGTERLPVCELEIELLRGSPMAVIETARRWVDRHGLWLDTRSKAERGDLLARGLAQAPQRGAAAVSLKRGMQWSEARRAVLASCLEQVSVNASQVAAGDFADEHVHQLRVGLRRLRTALRLFDGKRADPPLVEAAGQWFGQLGTARDQAAVAAPLHAEMQRALQGIGLALPAPRLPVAAGACDDPVTGARSALVQHLMLDLLATLQASGAGEARSDTFAMPDADTAEPLRNALARRLNRWHRRVARDVARFAELDDAQRHMLRKRAKRLRYAAEFAAALFEPGAVRRYVKPLRALQDALGSLNDVAVAIDAFRTAQADGAPALFALGWLAARREALLAHSAPTLKGFAKARRFWGR